MTEAEIKKTSKELLIQKYIIAIKTKFAMSNNSRDKEIVLMEREILSRMNR